MGSTPVFLYSVTLFYFILNFFEAFYCFITNIQVLVLVLSLHLKNINSMTKKLWKTSRRRQKSPKQKSRTLRSMYP